MHDTQTATVGRHRWVCLVGAVQVRAASRSGPVLPAGSRKARTLLALLAVDGGRLVTVDRLVDALWAGAPPRQPAANVASLVSRLRATLGPATIDGDRTGYRLGAALRVDLHHAAGLVADAEAAAARGEPEAAVAAAGAAREVLEAGPVLADQPDAAWTDRARIQHADLIRRARHAAAEAALRLGRARAAVAAAAAAVRDDPYDEPACRSLMSALVLAGEPARALLAYERLRGLLADELGTAPAPPTRDLHLAILREEAVPPGRLGAVRRAPRPRAGAG